VARREEIGKEVIRYEGGGGRRRERKGVLFLLVPNL